MSRNTKTSSLTEAAMICGILVLMSMFSFYVLPFIDFLFPLPAIILGKRRGYKYSALSLVSASFIIMMTLGIPIGLMYLFMYTPIAVVMTYLIVKEKKPSTAIFGGAIAMLVSLVVVLYAMQLFTGVEISKEITTIIDEMIEMQKSMSNALGMDQPQVQAMIKNLDNASELIVIMLPAILMMVSILISVINYFMAQRLALRFKIVISPLNDLSMFFLPRSFIFGIGFLMILSYILAVMKFSNMDVILINISMVARMALLVQGLALVKYYMIKNKINNFLRVVIFIFIMFIPVLSNLVTLLAVVDFIIDFRKLKIKK